MDEWVRTMPLADFDTFNLKTIQRRRGLQEQDWVSRFFSAIPGMKLAVLILHWRFVAEPCG
jgi:hypothetical protein